MTVRFVKAKILASALSAAVIFAAGSGAFAAQSTATASVSATVNASGSVGAAAVATTVTTAQPTSTGTTIRSVPVSTTSNIGYSAPAPSRAAKAATTAATASRALPATARGNGGSASTAVAVAGAPNQTFSVVLPSPTSYVAGDQLVNLSGFEHNAGATPAVGADGAGVFEIGAAVDEAPAGELQTASADNGSALTRAFTQRSPIVNIIVSYN